jgi:hypothetical protein
MPAKASAELHSGRLQYVARQLRQQDRQRGSGVNQFAPSDITVPEPATVMFAILNILLSSFVRHRRRE